MKLWHVEFMIADKHLHETMLYLEGKAYNAQYHPVKNGADEEKPKKNGDRATKGSQIEWLVAHIKDEIEPHLLKEGFAKAGFRPTGLYAALSRAVEQKKIKKMAHGTYKPVGA